MVEMVESDLPGLSFRWFGVVVMLDLTCLELGTSSFWGLFLGKHIQDSFLLVDCWNYYFSFGKHFFLQVDCLHSCDVWNDVGTCFSLWWTFLCGSFVSVTAASWIQEALFHTAFLCGGLFFVVVLLFLSRQHLELRRQHPRGSLAGGLSIRDARMLLTLAFCCCCVAFSFVSVRRGSSWAFLFPSSGLV